tara:strand:- start:811 stop:1071 length:261 start_codon:yes stop_codon:yes gene_type:complete
MKHLISSRIQEESRLRALLMFEAHEMIIWRELQTQPEKFGWEENEFYVSQLLHCETKLIKYRKEIELIKAALSQHETFIRSNHATN